MENEAFSPKKYKQRGAQGGRRVSRGRGRGNQTYAPRVRYVETSPIQTTTFSKKAFPNLSNEDISSQKPWFRGYICSTNQNGTAELRRVSDDKLYRFLAVEEGYFSQGDHVLFQIETTGPSERAYNVRLTEENIGNTNDDLSVSDTEDEAEVIHQERQIKGHLQQQQQQQPQQQEQKQRQEYNVTSEYLKHDYVTPSVQISAKTIETASSNAETKKDQPKKMPATAESDEIMKRLLTAFQKFDDWEKSLKDKEQRLEDIILYHEDIIKNIRKEVKPVKKELKKIAKYKIEIEEFQKILTTSQIPEDQTEEKIMKEEHETINRVRVEEVTPTEKIASKKQTKPPEKVHETAKVKKAQPSSVSKIHNAKYSESAEKNNGPKGTFFTQNSQITPHQQFVPKLVPSSEIHPKSNKLQVLISSLIQEKKFKDAVEMVAHKKNPPVIVFELYKAMQYPREISVKLGEKILSIFSNSLDWQYKIANKWKFHPSQHFEQQRNLCTLYNRILSTRNYDNIMAFLKRICNSPHIRATLQNLPSSSLRVLQLAQSYLSALISSSPTQSSKLNRLYTAILKDLQLFDKKRRERLLKWSNFVEDEIEKSRKPKDENATTKMTFPSLHSSLLPEEVDSENEDIGEKVMEEDISEQNKSITTSEKDDGDELGNNIEEEEEEETASNIDFKKLSSNMETCYENSKQTDNEYLLKIECMKEIEETCKKALNEYDASKLKIYIYGSSSSNFGTSGCDIDMSLIIENSKIDDSVGQGQVLRCIQNLMNSDMAPFPYIKPKQAVLNSRVPILKIVDSKRNFEVDLCINNLLGVVNTKLLKTYSEIDPRVRPFVHCVKHWASRRFINRATNGSLSSYSYVLLSIMYLQTVEILPSLQMLANRDDVAPGDISEPHNVNAYDCRYFANIEKLDKVWKRKENKMSLGELFVGFFNYYILNFDFNNSTCSIRNGKPLKKKWDNVISIEDPFEARDLGSVVSEEMLFTIISEFKRAQLLLNNGASFNDVVMERENYEDENIYEKPKEEYQNHMANEQDIIKLIEEKKLYKGLIRVNKKNMHEAYVTVEGFNSDILIDGLHSRNRALHGDVVAIRIEESSSTVQVQLETKNSNTITIEEESVQVLRSKKATGVVVAILEKKSPRIFACTLMKEDPTGTNKGFRWLLPLDKAYPRIMCRFQEFTNLFGINARQLEELIFVAEMNTWKTTQHYPRGKLLGTLGFKRDLWAQRRASIVQGIPSLYECIFMQKKLQNSLKAASLKVNELINVANTSFVTDLSVGNDDEIYEDWRGKRVFTIDPLTSRDLDDALSIELVSDQTYAVTVYVADVCRFIKEGDDIDLEARKRATSVYVVDQVEHMLDPRLSQNLCSLLPGVTRYAVAVRFLINSSTAEIDLNAISFHRAIITSCCQLDYDTAQEIIERKKHLKREGELIVKNGHSLQEICNDILILNDIAGKLRKQRKQSGSVFLTNQKLYFQVDEDGFPVQFSKDVHSESHILIEEFMLVANKLVGKTLYDQYGEDALLRRHTPPTKEKCFKTIQKLSNALKILIDEEDTQMRNYLESFDPNMLLEQNMSMQEIMSKFITIAKSIPEKKYNSKNIVAAIMHSMLREMQLAKYVRVKDANKDEYGTNHFALNIQYYTHFTSPIRRYADCIVHRMLLRYMEEKKNLGTRTEMTLKGDELSKVVEHINNNAYAAKNIGEICSRQYLAFYLMPILEKKIVRVEAVVISLGRRSFTIFLPEYSIEVSCNIMKHFKQPPSSIKEIESGGEDAETKKQIKEEDVQSGEAIQIDSTQKNEFTVETLILKWERQPLPAVSSLAITGSTIPGNTLESNAGAIDIQNGTSSNSNSNESNNQSSNNSSHIQHNRTVEIKILKTILVDLDVDTEITPHDIYVYNVWDTGMEIPQELEKSKFKSKLRTPKKKSAGAARAINRVE